MKKLFTFIGSAILLSQSGFAQITLTSALGYTTGTSFTIQTCSTTGTLPSAAGANVSVDYSAFTPNGTPQTQNFVDPSTTTYASTFPTATVAAPAISTQGNTGYTYYKNSSTKLELIGIGTTAYLMTYSDPTTVLTFPMSFNDNTTDNFKAQYSVNGIDIVRSGVVTTVADAHGTIKTPAGTSSYLRLKITQQIIDSFFMSGDLVQLSTSQVTTYNYMNNGSSAPIFSYSEIITGQGTTISAYYNTSIPTGITESSANNLIEVALYPNPAKNTIMLSANMFKGEKVNIKVIDINGKEIMTESTVWVSGSNELPLTVSTLSSGLYSIILQSESIGTKSLKFTIE